MTDPSQPTTGATPAQTPPPFWKKAAGWVAIAAGVVIAAVTLIRLVSNYTVLPSCDSRRMTDTLRNIYRDKKTEFKGISNVETVNTSSSEVTCTAVVDTGTGQESINYRSFWEGWQAQVSVRAGLPLCNSPQTADTLRDIFKQRKVAINDISGFKTVSTSEAENVCTAQVDAPSELATITYRIYRKEGATQVLISDVKSQPK